MTTTLPPPRFRCKRDSTRHAREGSEDRSLLRGLLIRRHRLERGLKRAFDRTLSWELDAIGFLEGRVISAWCERTAHEDEVTR